MEFASALPQWLLYLIAGLIGAILGSFANVCIFRMPRRESIIWPRSHCPHCDHVLSPWENVPLISFVLLRGRCRKCKGRISFQYPLVETAAIALSLLAWWHFGEPIGYLVYFCLLIVPLLIASIIDLKHYIIPDSITIPGIIVGFGVHVILGGDYSYRMAALDSLLGILVGGGALYLVAIAYEKLKKQEGLGGGDVKLIAMLGAFFGWRASILILLISSLLGSFVGLLLIIILRKGLKYAIPFGPFLAVAGLIYLFAGEWIINWYLGLFF
jgi:leader peptidase (prepilin peptidase)/N-methyltransferase